jgi:hypothetical protein
MTTAPPGTQAACLDIQRAYRNSPVLPAHKRYIALHWRDKFYIDHVLPFGLATAGGIQGAVADAVVDILEERGIGPTVKWVDDFNLFREPRNTETNPDGITIYFYSYDLDDIIAITLPLGVPWHSITIKGHIFSFYSEYVGFDWDFDLRTVTLPERKRLKYLSRVTIYTSEAKASFEATAKLLGTLQHTTFIYTQGRSYLPSIARFLSTFEGHAFRLRFIPRDVRRDLSWWQNVLSRPDISRSLRPRTFVDKDIWVDASTSWGIGLVVGGRWAAWRLAEGWRGDGRDIGWAETIAMELAALWIAAAGISDAHVRVNSDNTGVIGALTKGRSRNPHRNSSIRRTSFVLAPINITIDAQYVTSATNLADPISRGEIGPPDARLPVVFSLPQELAHFLLYV